jgi:hypothetical protein
VNGQKNGRGRWFNSDNYSFEGLFSYDQYFLGTRTYPDGTKYIGQWQYNNKHGRGDGISRWLKKRSYIFI